MSVTALSFDNVVEIVAVMSDAFRDYPVMRWTLGADGKTVTVQRSIDAGGQSLTARVVMNKAP